MEVFVKQFVQKIKKKPPQQIAMKALICQCFVVLNRAAKITLKTNDASG